MTWMLDRVGRHIAAYLQRPASGYEPFTPTDPAALRALIKPGDILLIEGRTHIAGVIKYLTQSTWSHAALYVGPIEGQESSGGEPCDLVESNLEAGIISVPLSTYFDFHTRICRPVGL
ncbi:MAG: lipo-like protein, partial [Pseudolabrys sp.]